METQPKNKGGRPLGSASRMAKEARERAQATGQLPHEIMLDIARGNPQHEKHVNPETGEIVVRVVSVPIDMRLDAAKAAAPYYAPKISTVEVIAGVTNDDLDSLIAQLAAEAGVSLGLDGAGEEAEEDQRSEAAERTRTDEQPTGIRRRPVTGS